MYNHLVFWQQRCSVYNKVPCGTYCRGLHRSACFPGMSRDYFLCVACCCKGDATACSLHIRCGCVWRMDGAVFYVPANTRVSEAEQQSTNRIRFSLELETAIQLRCHIDYWKCLCMVLHSFVFDDLNSMQNCDVVTVTLLVRKKRIIRKLHNIIVLYVCVHAVELV